MERHEKQEVMGIPKWSELNPDLLRCVFNRLSFTSLNEVKLVCSSWYSASRDCVPNQNQIPWLIIFPVEENNNRCVLFVPEDNEKVYKSRDLGVDFAQSYCLTTCGSWLLLLNIVDHLYILNLFTGERIDLPDIASRFKSKYDKPCLWIDNKTKDYLVIMSRYGKFTKKGYNNWRNLPLEWCKDELYNDKNQKLYVHAIDIPVVDMPGVDIPSVDIWDFSGDNPRKDKTLSLPPLGFSPEHYPFFLENDIFMKSRMAVTLSGDVLMVSYVKRPWGRFYFRISKMNRVNNKWVQIDSLGDEALIYDMGITVIANRSIIGIKRNSIYFSDRDLSFFFPKDQVSIFVYDLTTQEKEPLPQCVLSSMLSSPKARWFFPC